MFDNKIDEIYSQILDSDSSVVMWKYKFVPIVYFDHVTGDQLTFYIKFLVEYQDGMEWVETVLSSRMKPEDKYLYAHHAAKSAGARFRGLTMPEHVLIQTEYNA